MPQQYKIPQRPYFGDVRVQELAPPPRLNQPPQTVDETPLRAATAMLPPYFWPRAFDHEPYPGDEQPKAVTGYTFGPGGMPRMGVNMPVLGTPFEETLRLQHPTLPVTPPVPAGRVRIVFPQGIPPTFPIEKIDPVRGSTPYGMSLFDVRPEVFEQFRNTPVGQEEVEFSSQSSTAPFAEPFIRLRQYGPAIAAEQLLIREDISPEHYLLNPPRAHIVNLFFDAAGRVQAVLSDGRVVPYDELRHGTVTG